MTDKINLEVGRSYNIEPSQGKKFPYKITYVRRETLEQEENKGEWETFYYIFHQDRKPSEIYRFRILSEDIIEEKGDSVLTKGELINKMVWNSNTHNSLIESWIGEVKNIESSKGRSLEFI